MKPQGIQTQRRGRSSSPRLFHTRPVTSPQPAPTAASPSPRPCPQPSPTEFPSPYPQKHRQSFGATPSLSAASGTGAKDQAWPSYSHPRKPSSRTGPESPAPPATSSPTPRAPGHHRKPNLPVALVPGDLLQHLRYRLQVQAESRSRDSPSASLHLFDRQYAGPCRSFRVAISPPPASRPMRRKAASSNTHPTPPSAFFPRHIMRWHRIHNRPIAIKQVRL